MFYRFLPRVVLAAVLLVGTVASSFGQTPAATTNGSVTISNGNAFQQVLAALSAGSIRRAITIQNNNTNNDGCWIFIGATASATKGTSILLAPGASYQRYYPYVPSDNIAATCATTNDTLYIDTQ